MPYSSSPGVGFGDFRRDVTHILQDFPISYPKKLDNCRRRTRHRCIPLLWRGAPQGRGGAFILKQGPSVQSPESRAASGPQQGGPVVEDDLHRNCLQERGEPPLGGE